MIEYIPKAQNYYIIWKVEKLVVQFLMKLYFTNTSAGIASHFFLKNEFIDACFLEVQTVSFLQESFVFT